ncbi:protein of unknown function [Aminobacter niigataensis]|nr:protein of unknown function [Aminobacter niigataensis]
MDAHAMRGRRSGLSIVSRHSTHPLPGLHGPSVGIEPNNRLTEILSLAVTIVVRLA